MDDEDSTCVALLHDVIEDNPSYSLAYMGSTAMMPPAVVEALRLLTHDKDNVSYEDYLKGKVQQTGHQGETCRPEAQLGRQ
jgi:(p)ppGpp synthase/HD superfamily hydrolase